MLGEVLAFVSVQGCLLVGLKRCVTVLGVTPGLFGDHWVSGSLEGVMCAPLNVLVVLVCTAYVFMWLVFSLLPTLPPFIFIVLFIIYPVGSPYLFVNLCCVVCFRMEWLQQGSRELFGTIIEDQVCMSLL